MPNENSRVNARLVMLTAVIASMAIIMVIGWWFWCGQQTTVLLVRHGDRQGNLDQLSAAGLARAQELMHVAEKASVAAIYQSEFQRTQQTAALLANALGIGAETFPAADMQALADDIRQHHRGQTVLVVGHSDSLPQIIRALGGPSIANLADNEFDNFFVLMLCRCSWRPAKLVNLQYGAMSP